MKWRRNWKKQNGGQKHIRENFWNWNKQKITGTAIEGKERKDITQIKQEMKEASEVLEQIRREYMRLHNINEKNSKFRDNLRTQF